MGHRVASFVCDPTFSHFSIEHRLVTDRQTYD